MPGLGATLPCSLASREKGQEAIMCCSGFRPFPIGSEQEPACLGASCGVALLPRWPGSSPAERPRRPPQSHSPPPGPG